MRPTVNLRSVRQPVWFRKNSITLHPQIFKLCWKDQCYSRCQRLGPGSVLGNHALAIDRRLKRIPRRLWLVGNRSNLTTRGVQIDRDAMPFGFLAPRRSWRKMVDRHTMAFISLQMAHLLSTPSDWSKLNHLGFGPKSDQSESIESTVEPSEDF